MARELVPNFWKFILIVSAMQIVAAVNSMCDIQSHIEEFNKKLGQLQDKLDLFDYFNDTGALTTVVRQAEVSKRPPSNCEEALKHHNESGVYQIYVPESGFIPLYCMADPNKGRPWTVLQRRVDNSTNFYDHWIDYKRGFGNLNRNFFMGLEIWHVLTTQSEPQELWVKMTYVETVNVYYDNFSIGDETESYKLNVLGEFRRDTGNSMVEKCDGSNCSHNFHRSWWRNYCFFSNLYYSYYESRGYVQPMAWYLTNRCLPMNYVQMAIRPSRTWKGP